LFLCLTALDFTMELFGLTLGKRHVTLLQILKNPSRDSRVKVLPMKVASNTLFALAIAFAPCAAQARPVKPIGAVGKVDVSGQQVRLQTKVHFWADKWYELYVDAVPAGGQDSVVELSVAKLPVYVKESSIVPAQSISHDAAARAIRFGAVEGSYKSHLGT
jgi:hypothetical protein